MTEAPSKQQLIDDLNTSFLNTMDWIANQEETRFNKEIIPGKWTIAGHLYHLIKSTKGVSKGMSMPKLGLRTMFGKSRHEERTYQQIFELYTNTLTNTSVKAPNAYEAEPGRIFDRANLIHRFEHERKDFVNALEKWSEKDMSLYQLPHPVMGKFTLREFIYFTILHTYHHLNILKEKYEG